MFHPLYNADGSFSKFRLICILVFASCMFVSGIIKALENDSSVNVSSAASNSEPNSQSLPQESINDQVIASLQEGADFMKTCGIVNHGYDDCAWKPGESIERFYDTGVETGDDGFIIVMTSKNSQQPLIYSKLEADSNGRLLAFDKNGNRVKEAKFMDNHGSRLSLNRRTDNLSGEPSLSGFAPLSEDPLPAQKVGEFAKM